MKKRSLKIEYLKLLIKRNSMFRNLNQFLHHAIR